MPQAYRQPSRTECQDRAEGRQHQKAANLADGIAQERRQPATPPGRIARTEQVLGGQDADHEQGQPPGAAPTRAANERRRPPQHQREREGQSTKQHAKAIVQRRANEPLRGET